jgi:hypothetical protein
MWGREEHGEGIVSSAFAIAPSQYGNLCPHGAIDRSEVVECCNGVTPDRVPTFLPIRRAYIVVRILLILSHLVSTTHSKSCMQATHGKPESLDKTQCFDRASDVQVIHRDPPQHALGIDQIALADVIPLSQIINYTVTQRTRYGMQAAGREYLTLTPPSARLLRPGVT